MSTDQETIKSYDANAEDWAKRMRSKKNIAHEYLEKPAIYGKLGNVQGLSMLCVGCGSGEECGYLLGRGANKVVGIDVSKGLIEQAKYAFPGAEFQTMDIEQADFPEESFDFVYSSLVMHYLKDWRRALTNVHRMLKKDGRFLFSTHHPVKWGASDEKIGTKRLVHMGYSKDNAADQKFEIFGDYFTTRLSKDIWFDKMPVNYYHKPLTEIFREIKESGFIVSDFIEPQATKQAEKVKKDFYEIHQKIPLFIIMELIKK